MKTKEILRMQILNKVDVYSEMKFIQDRFIPGESSVPIASQVADGRDLRSLIAAALDFQLAAGPLAEQFESDLREWHGGGSYNHALVCNSGSSANLLAISALTSQQIDFHSRLYPGDEVIMIAAGFPTTLNAILQNNLVPVFVDIDLGTYNANVSQIEDACSERTKAIFLPHTLGNPFNLIRVQDAIDRNGLWLIEDNADAFGSEYRGRKTGTFGDFSTLSFYPAHHISCGEGGAVIVHDHKNKRIVQSFRDWGRDCRCPPGRDNMCGKRFDQQFGTLPQGYDHKYVYSHIGYNMKMTELQAAVGISQLKKLPYFASIRRRNWNALYEGIKSLEEFFILPYTQKGNNPNWFGFVLTVREGAPFNRDQIVRYLVEKKIGVRMLLGGNLIHQPAYKDMIYRSPVPLPNSDIAMRNTFWIGVCPSITEEMADYVVQTFSDFIKEEI